MILSLHLNYICVCIDMFVHHIMVSMLIYLSLLYNIIIVCTSSWFFCSIYLRCMGYSTTALLLHLCLYEYFVNITYMFAAICLCNFYSLILVQTPDWEASHVYFRIYSSIVSIIIDLHSQNWINIYLFELVVTCIETCIFVPSFSISHIFISVIIFLFCFLLLGTFFDLNPTL